MVVQSRKVDPRFRGDVGKEDRDVGCVVEHNDKEPIMTKTLLQVAIILFGCVPVFAGGVGAFFGADIFGFSMNAEAVNSHFRYLSGLLLGIGLTFWSMVPKIEDKGDIFRSLTLIVFLGGLIRLVAATFYGSWTYGVIFALIMELVITPALCLGQMYVSKTTKNIQKN